MTSSKMAAILDFTESSDFSTKLENCKYFLLELKNMIQLNILLLFVTFQMFFTPKMVKNTHYYLKMA